MKQNKRMEGDMMKRNLLNRFLQNFRMPAGFWGRVILRSMNRGHSSLSQWGLSHLEWQPEWCALDIGCGGGANLALMLQRGPQGKVFGVDPSAESVAFARKKNRASLSSRCFVEQASADRLPFADASFDVVTAFETVYFWDDLHRAFTETARVLRENGYFLICCEMADPAKSTWPGRIDGMVIRTADTLKSVLFASGFEAAALFRHKKGAICLIARKTGAVSGPSRL